MIKAVCPYCGHAQQVEMKVEPSTSGRLYDGQSTRNCVVVCDTEDGGCDNYYAVAADLRFSVTTGAISGAMQPELRNLKAVRRD
jgi:hypothetical protein